MEKETSQKQTQQPIKKIYNQKIKHNQQQRQQQHSNNILTQPIKPQTQNKILSLYLKSILIPALLLTHLTVPP